MKIDEYKLRAIAINLAKAITTHHVPLPKGHWQRIIPIEGIENDHCFITSNHQVYDGEKLLDVIRVRHSSTGPVFHMTRKIFLKLYKLT